MKDSYSGNDPSVPVRRDEDPFLLNALVLAYIGDTLYDLYVRTRLVRSSHASAGTLHRKAIHFVCAEGQARSVKALIPELTEKETEIVKRARNAKSTTVPKHASIDDYHHATAFEALLGFLYLSGQQERCDTIMKMAYDIRSEGDKNV